ncbi:MAG TPA: hypothetical protein VGX97_02095 [bacterium]|nr:hypothetical protein [bacterium]
MTLAEQWRPGQAYISRPRGTGSRPRWPHEFRHFVSFLFTPPRYARAHKIHDLQALEQLEPLRADLLLSLYHLAGAPTVYPDGRRNVLAMGEVLLPTARRILRRVNKSRREETASVTCFELARNPNRPYTPDSLWFPPVICEIAYELAGTLGVHLGANGGPPGVQRMVQSVIWRVVTALAQEDVGAAAARDALEQDVNSVLRTGQQDSLVRDILRRLQSPATRDMILLRVKELLVRPAASRFGELVWWEQQGLLAMLMPDGTVSPVGPFGWTHRSGAFPSPVKEALLPVLREAEGAPMASWRICPLCARPFPQSGHMAKACPPCRGRYGRRGVEWRLARAAGDPVIFEVLPESSARPVRLVIAEGIDAPTSLRKIEQGAGA